VRRAPQSAQSAPCPICGARLQSAWGLWTEIIDQTRSIASGWGPRLARRRLQRRLIEHEWFHHEWFRFRRGLGRCSPAWPSSRVEAGAPARGTWRSLLFQSTPAPGICPVQPRARRAGSAWSRSRPLPAAKQLVAILFMHLPVMAAIRGRFLLRKLAPNRSRGLPAHPSRASVRPSESDHRAPAQDSRTSSPLAATSRDIPAVQPAGPAFDCFGNCPPPAESPGMPLPHLAVKARRSRLA